MAHTYTSNLLHCVFSTKERTATIPAHLQEQLCAYVFGIAKNIRIELLAIGGTQNHIHLLITLPASRTLSEVIQTLKANSSRWVREHGVAFSWQEGYGAFSVSPSQVERVKDYILHQSEHHAKRNFDEEFLRCCVRLEWIMIRNMYWDSFLGAVPSGLGRDVLDSRPSTHVLG